MNISLTTAIVSACLLAAVWIGMRVRRFLPGDHLSPESRDSVKLAIGVVATMSALLLGLLVSSAKTSYDTSRTEVMQVASQYRLLDRLLAIYGPQAAEVRGELRALIEASTFWSMWSDNATVPAQFKPKAFDAFYVALLRLEARLGSDCGCGNLRAMRFGRRHAAVPSLVSGATNASRSRTS
jgi:hypothetical protein